MLIYRLRMGHQYLKETLNRKILNSSNLADNCKLNLWISHLIMLVNVSLVLMKVNQNLKMINQIFYLIKKMWEKKFNHHLLVFNGCIHKKKKFNHHPLVYNGYMHQKLAAKKQILKLIYLKNKVIHQCLIKNHSKIMLH